MRAVILTGGKGERLMPLTKDTRKAYLPLGNKGVIDHIIDRLPKDIDYSITENDGGALAAVAEALTGNDPVLVICGDNYFTASLDGFVKAFGDGKKLLIAVYDVQDKELAQNYGVVEVLPMGRIKRFAEKPYRPASTIVSTGIYIFPQILFERVRRLAALYPKANIGDLLINLMYFCSVYAYQLDGVWIDIGTPENYRKAQEIVSEKRTVQGS